MLPRDIPEPMLSWTGRGASDTSSSSSSNNIWLGYYLMDLRGQGPWGFSRMSPLATARAGDPTGQPGQG